VVAATIDLDVGVGQQHGATRDRRHGRRIERVGAQVAREQRVVVAQSRVGRVTAAASTMSVGR
jgi:hypothetical protein